MSSSTSEKFGRGIARIREVINDLPDLDTYLGTLLLMVSIIAVYYTQLAAQLVYRVPSRQLEYWFTTNPVFRPTPGMILAPFSHAFFPHLDHVLGNLAFLAIVGAAVEIKMDRREYVAFYLVSAYVSTWLGTLLSGLGTFGASGGILALAGFYSVHTLIHHQEEFEFRADDVPWIPDKTVLWRTYRGWFVLLVLPAVILYLALQLLGIFPTGRTAVHGHAVGLALGIAWGVLREI